jgi:DnaJ-class molecular chaperone
LESLPDEECKICEGTGIRNDELGKQERAKDPSYTCNGCKGKGSRDNFYRLYPFHVDNVLAFGEFCAQSGGFKIL